MNLFKFILPLILIALSNASNLEEANDGDFFFFFHVENKELHTILINNTGKKLFISSEIDQLSVSGTNLNTAGSIVSWSTYSRQKSTSPRPKWSFYLIESISEKDLQKLKRNGFFRVENLLRNTVKYKTKLPDHLLNKKLNFEFIFKYNTIGSEDITALNFKKVMEVNEVNK